VACERVKPNLISYSTVRAVQIYGTEMVWLWQIK